MMWMSLMPRPQGGREIPTESMKIAQLYDQIIEKSDVVKETMHLLIKIDFNN